MLENTEGVIKNDNPEKLATQCGEDEEKQNKHTIQYMLETTIPNKTQIK